MEAFVNNSRGRNARYVHRTLDGAGGGWRGGGLEWNVLTNRLVGIRISRAYLPINDTCKMCSRKLLGDRIM
eukprot:scaffold1396_cov252-Pinguiococcus_pyrenoidosus.AAC.25